MPSVAMSRPSSRRSVADCAGLPLVASRLQLEDRRGHAGSRMGRFDGLFGVKSHGATALERIDGIGVAGGRGSSSSLTASYLRGQTIRMQGDDLQAAPCAEHGGIRSLIAGHGVVCLARFDPATGWLSAAEACPVCLTLGSWEVKPGPSGSVDARTVGQVCVVLSHPSIRTIRAKLHKVLESRWPLLALTRRLCLLRERGTPAHSP